MMDDKKFISEYKKLQNQAAPDIWERIEAEIEPMERTEAKIQELPLRQKKRNLRPYYCLTAAALAGVMILAGRMGSPSENSSGAAATYAENVVSETGAAVEMAEAAEMTEAADSMVVPEAAGEELAVAEAAGETEALEYAAAEDTTLARTETSESEVAGPSGTSGSSGASGGASMPGNAAPGGSPVNMAARALAVPDNAVTVSADEQYFSEAILEETGLLCEAVVTDVSFAYDESGKALHVIYDIVVEDVLYAEDYINKAETMTIRSPIIKTDGDEAYVLYQMQVGETYLLPLKQQEASWELLYPFAPQIQIIGKQSYRFHSGYASLINEQTIVTEADKEGENDFYYDRMLMREDNAFLSDFISLVR